MKTMKEIAELANVSQSTVSRILNGSAGVSPAKRARVMEVVRKLDYKPNQTARSLASSRSQLIGVLLPDLMTPFFSEVLANIESMCARNGYNIIVCNSQGNERKEQEAFASLKARQVDGLLVGLTSPHSRLLSVLQKSSMHSVVITQDHPGIDCVGTSHAKGGELVARHFLENGVEKFLFLGPEHDEKLTGYQDALRIAGIPENRIEVLAVSDWFLHVSEQGYKAARAYLNTLSERSMKSGIFAVNDTFAFGAIHAAQDLGLSIPDTVAIVGFDNNYYCTSIRPLLSSVAQPTEDIGRIAVDMLLKRIDNSAASEERVSIQLEPELIRRETS